MAYEPCPGCEQQQGTANYEQSGPLPSDQYDASPGDVIDPGAPQDPVAEEQAGSLDYTITWDPADTTKEKAGLAIAGVLAFLAPFAGFAVAAKVAHNDRGDFRPVGYGAITFFAMRAAAIGVLHVTDNMPTVNAPTALGAVMPQMPRRAYYPKAPARPYYPKAPAVGRAPCRGCR